MRKRLSHVKKRLAAYARSIGALRGRSENEREVTDIGGGSGKRTVVLREKVWRIELSRRNIRRFFADHKIATGATVAAVAAIVFGRLALLSFASTADFYPSSCLGSWDNVQNALGKPDVGFGSSITSFTALNSAIFGTSSAQMFCGNFFGDTNIAALEGKSFEKADLVLSWAFEFPESGAAPAATGGGGGSTAIAPPAPPQSDGAASGTVLGIDTSSVPAIVASTTDSATGDALVAPSASDSIPVISSDASDTIASSSSAEIAPVSVPAPDPVVAPPPPATESSSDMIAPPPSAPSSDTTDPAASPTSLLKMFLGVAYADEASSAAAAFNATTSFADTSTTQSVASSVEGIPTSPQPTAMTLNTSMFQNIVLPASKPGDVIGIVYSTDGVTWQPLQDINKDNWQVGHYAIPITSWDQLKHLQVAFIGLSDPDSPKIFLDAAGVEVSYDDPPQGTVNITPDTTQQQPPDDTTPLVPPPPGSEPPPAEILQKASVSESDVFDQGAKQQCVVAPFSQTISPGDTAAFSLQLFSGLATPSSTQKSSLISSTIPYGYQHAIYDTRLGSLPTGVTGSIKPGAFSDVSSTQTIRLYANSGAGQGSFSLLMIYRERQDDASLRSTACQLNLVIQ